MDGEKSVLCCILSDLAAALLSVDTLPIDVDFVEDMLRLFVQFGFVFMLFFIYDKLKGLLRNSNFDERLSTLMSVAIVIIASMVFGYLLSLVAQLGNITPGQQFFVVAGLYSVTLGLSFIVFGRQKLTPAERNRIITRVTFSFLLIAPFVLWLANDMYKVLQSQYQDQPFSKKRLLWGEQLFGRQLGKSDIPPWMSLAAAYVLKTKRIGETNFITEYFFNDNVSYVKNIYCDALATLLIALLVSILVIFGLKPDDPIESGFILTLLTFCVASLTSTIQKYRTQPPSLGYTEEQLSSVAWCTPSTCKPVTQS